MPGADPEKKEGGGGGGGLNYAWIAIDQLVWDRSYLVPMKYYLRFNLHTLTLPLGC